MTRFEFLSVLLSVVLGLAIARILAAWGELIRCRRRVVLFAPHLAWTGFVFVVMIFGWWSAWDARDRAVAFTFPVYLVQLLQPAVVVLVAFLLTPPVPEEGRLDLRHHFLDNAGWIFGLLALAALLAVGASLLREAPGLPATLARGAMFLLFATLALLRDVRAHRIGAALAFAALAVLGALGR